MFGVGLQTITVRLGQFLSMHLTDLSGGLEFLETTTNRLKLNYSQYVNP